MLNLTTDHWLTLKKGDSLTVSMKNGDAKTQSLI